MLDRTQAPAFTRSTTFELIQPEEITLHNSAKIFLVPGGNQEVVKVEFILSAGRWFDQHWGASYFSFQLLSKGTRSKSAFAIAELFDRYGSHLEISPGLDVVSISLYSLTKNLEPSLQLVLELLEESTFPEKEIELLKSVYLQNLKVNNEKTSFQASKLIRKKLFGENHPYGKELEETDVLALTRDQMIQHYSTFGRDITVIVSGKTDSLAPNFFSDKLSGLSIAKSTSRAISQTTSTISRELVEKSGSVQSSIRMGKRSLNRADEDYAAVQFLNHILGGYFGSRLMKNIREEKGLSYGIHSSLHTLKHDSYLVIGADVNKENLELTFTEIRNELKRLRSEKIGEGELETARNHFIGSLQSEITTPFAHAEKVRNLFLFGLPKDFYQTMINTIDGIQAEELITVANNYFSEDSFTEIAVG